MLHSLRSLRRALVASLGLAACSLSTVAAPSSLSPKVNDLVDRFFSPPEFRNLRLSPDGAHISFEKEIAGQMVLATMDTKTGKRALLGVGVGQTILDSRWVGPDHILFEMHERRKPTLERGSDATMLPSTAKSITYYAGHWIVNSSMSKTLEVPGVERVLEFEGVAPQDPSRVFFVEQSADQFHSPLYCYDPLKRKMRLFEANPGRVVEWHTDTTGRVRLATMTAGAGAWSLIYRETEQSSWQPLEVPARSEFVAFDQTGQALVITYPDQSGRRVAQSFDLKERKLAGKPISDPVYDVDAYAIREPRTGTPVGLVYADDRAKFIWFDPGFEQLQKALAPALPGALILPLGGTAAGEILVAATADTAPTRYFLFNPQTGKLRLLLDQSPKVGGLKLSPMKPIAFTTAAGVELHGYLTLPPDQPEGKALPTIALVHGGPRVRDQWGYDAEVQYFAALGYAVLQVNYRGSAGYGDAHRQKTVIAAGENSVDDIAAALRWAVDQGIADPKRLVVCGGSFGGYIALGVATRYPDLPACVVGFAGVYDWEMETRTDYGNASDAFRWAASYHPDVKSSGPLYRAISPVHQAAAVKVPVLLLHGRDDRIVDIAQTELMARALRKAGKSVEVVADVEGVHGLPDEKLRRAYYQRVTTFLLKYAPPDKLP